MLKILALLALCADDVSVVSIVSTLCYVAHHVHRAEDVAVVSVALQVLGDVSKGAEVVWVLGRTGDVPDLVLRDHALERKGSKVRHHLR